MTLRYLPKYAQLDKLAGAIIRSYGNCASCSRIEGGGFIMTWGHIISRSVLHMRWDLDNALPLCWNQYTGEGCHPYFTTHPNEWKKFLFEHIGENKYWELVRRSNDITLMGQFDINEIKYRLQKEIKKHKIRVLV